MSRLLTLIAALPLLASGCKSPDPSRLEFTRLVAHWADYAHEDYLSFIEDAEPEIVQVGFYGAHFWSLAHTPQYNGYPAHFPVQGLTECGNWFENLNAELHKRNVRVVGHMNLKFLVGDPSGDKGPRGFFKFYREMWDDKELGRRPVEDPVELLEMDAGGSPITNNSYSIGGMKEYWGCLNNPHWRAVLKAWTKRGIERGLDGFQINYFYRHNCLCDYCVKAFKDYLTGRFTSVQLKEFGIADLGNHKFEEIVGWHDPKESTPLRREMLRFSQISNKMAFDEVFVQFGRSLKPDLIASQWNHIGNFGQISGDERCMLPAELWGTNEDYLWYSSGSSAFFTDLEAGILGEITLQARYVRGTFEDKPFTFGKYESTRIRVAISELLANGGAPMGFYTRFTDPEARKEIVRYYQFIKRYEKIFKANRSYAEVALIFPRKQVHNGNIEAVEDFKRIGNQLLNAHVLFDVVPDDLVTEEKMAGYAHVLKCDSGLDELQGKTDLNTFDCPPAVRVSASIPSRGKELDLHFVNYNRTEPAQKRSAGGGIKDEKPIAAPGVKADLILPENARVKRVEAITPEMPEPISMEFKIESGRLKIQTPEFFVYCVVRITFK
ncbi:MAG: hypothetical protein O3B01_04565 [Planctomycetota bacterium]|nr:hypothetical protein [Planctomycetota bacterium]